MKPPEPRELIAWALFATATALCLHTRTELALCTTQQEMLRTVVHATADLPFAGETGLPLQHNNDANSWGEPSMGHAAPLRDVADSALAASAPGATRQAHARRPTQPNHKHN
jgi:hypothetical protein